MALKKFCRCGKIIPQELKMCSQCEAKLNKQNKKVYKDYRASRTDIKEQRFYVSKEWLFTRVVVKRIDKGLCLLCLSKGMTSSMDTVHHIEELKDNWSKRLSTGNLISLCDRCHSKVHAKYKRNAVDKKEMQRQLEEISLDSREGGLENF